MLQDFEVHNNVMCKLGTFIAGFERICLVLLIKAHIKSNLGYRLSHLRVFVVFRGSSKQILG